MGPQIEVMLADIENIIRIKEPEKLSLPERASMFAALKTLCNSLRSVLEEDSHFSGYISEKISKVGHHGAGIFGFEETGRMGGDQSYFAYCDLSVLKDEIERLYR